MPSSPSRRRAHGERDRHPDDFRIGAFHDQLISYGSLPLSVVQWLMLGDSTAAAQGSW